MNRLSALRRLGATTAAIAAITLTASPAHAAVSKSDAGGDTKWTTSGTISAATTAEKARIDITNATFNQGSTNITLKFKVKNYSAITTAGTSTIYSLDLWNADFSRYVQVMHQRTAGSSDFSGLFWGTQAGGSGSACTGGAVKLGTSSTYETVTLTVPRSCFPKGWKFTKAAALTGYTRMNTSTGAYISGNDRTGTATSGFAAISWVPKA